MIEILMFILIGSILGLITGLIPGLHVNLVATLVVLLNIDLDPLFLISVLISMSISNISISYISSAYLGVPEADTFHTILPLHKQVLEGKGYEIIIKIIISIVSSLILGIILLPLFAVAIKTVYPYIKPSTPLILMGIILTIFFRDSKSKIASLLIIFLSSSLGLFTLKSSIKEPLMPLLSGLFGIPPLLFSMFEKSIIPKQVISFPEIKIKSFLRIFKYTLPASTIFSLIPSIGVSQAAIFLSYFTYMSSDDFIIASSSLNILNFLISLLTLFSIHKARSGVVVAIEKLVENIDLNHLIIFISITLVSILPSVLLTLVSLRVFVKYFDKINYRILCLVIIIFITASALVISSYMGIILLIVSTIIGAICIRLNVQRNLLMSALIVPTIFLLL